MACASSLLYIEAGEGALDHILVAGAR